MTQNEFATHWISIYSSYISGSSENERTYRHTLEKNAREVADNAINELKNRIPKSTKKKETIWR